MGDEKKDEQQVVKDSGKHYGSSTMGMVDSGTSCLVMPYADMQVF